MTTLTETSDHQRDCVLSLPDEHEPLCNGDVRVDSLRFSVSAGQDDVRSPTNTSVPISPEQRESSPITLSFYQINYSVGESAVRVRPCQRCHTETFPYWKPTERKSVLCNVSGIFSPGMNAILGKSLSICTLHVFTDVLKRHLLVDLLSIGSTGCGKSTLLDVLADRKDAEGLSGTVLVSGQTRPSHFKHLIGYVTQDGEYRRETVRHVAYALVFALVEALISGMLTVRENLLFSVNVRSSRCVSACERIDRVNRVINELDLHACADTLVGTDFVRGVSGGERKRTSIGMELVLSPDVLFLDEPTTGENRTPSAMFTAIPSSRT